MASLLLGRAQPISAGTGPELVEHVRSLDPDHILITGDLTTTALPAEFRAARAAWRLAGRPGSGHDHSRQPRPLHARPIAPAASSILRRVLAGTDISVAAELEQRRRSSGSTRPGRHLGEREAAPSPVDSCREMMARPGGRPALGRLPLSGRGPAEYQRNTRESRWSTPRSSAGGSHDRPPPLLLRPRARRLGLSARQDPEPALLEPRRTR